MSFNEHQSIRLNYSNKKNRKPKFSVANYEENEDQAESIDSGCIPDEILSDGDCETQAPSTSTLKPHYKKTQVHSKKVENFKKKSLSSETGSNSNEEFIRLQKELANLKRNPCKKNKRKEKKIILKMRILKKQREKLSKKHKKEKKAELAVKLGLVNDKAEASRVYNKCGSLVHSKFDFSRRKTDEREGPGTRFDLTGMLSRLLHEKEKVAKLEKSGRTQEACNFFKSNTWMRAMDKIDGEKVKDDIDLLKKSLSKRRLAKNKSRKKWAERIENTQMSQQKRQEQRKLNIQKRRDQKVAKHSKKGKGKVKGKKRSGHTPGF